MRSERLSRRSSTLLAAALVVSVTGVGVPALVPTAAVAATWLPGSTALVSLSSQSVQGDAAAEGQPAESVVGISPAQASADGRVVVWASSARTIATPAPATNYSALYARDNVTGITRRVDVANDTSAPLGQPGNFALSADGRWLAFGEDPAGTPNGNPIYLADLVAGTVAPIGTGAPAWLTVSDDGAKVAYNLGTGTPQVRVYDASSGLTDTVIAGNGSLVALSMSGDGSTLAFLATSTNLAVDNPVPAPAAGAMSLYTADLSGAGLHRVLTPSGALPDASGWSLATQGAFTPDADLLTFGSSASNWVPGDLNANQDVFVLDRSANTVTMETRRPSGGQGNGSSPTISADGTRVAFVSSHPSFVTGDTNAAPDAFVKDRAANTVVRVDVADDGTQAEGATGVSGAPLLTADGDHVLYLSSAENLVLNDANGQSDVFLTTLPGGTSPALVGDGILQGADLTWVDPSTDFGGVVLELNPGVDAPAQPGEGTPVDGVTGSSAHVTDFETGGQPLAFALFTKNAAQEVVSRKVAVVLPTPTPLPTTSTSIRRTASTVTYGRAVTFSGVVTSAGSPASDIVVSLQRRTKGSSTWTTLGSSVTAGDGVWSRSTVPSASADYRAVATNPGYQPSTSALTSVSVRYKVTASVTKATAKKGKKSTVTAKVGPKAKGKTVALQKRSKGAWRTVASKKLSSASKATFPVKPKKKGAWSYRVHVKADAQHLAADSPKLRIKRT